MIRKKLLTSLANYSAHNLFEKRAVAGTIKLIRSNNSFWDRGNISGHITVSSWVFSPDLQYVLLIHHSKLGKWLQIGGHVEGCDVTIVDTAIRELKEESGIDSIIKIFPGIYDVDIHCIPANSEVAGHAHYDIRLAMTVSMNIELKKNHESKMIKWVKINSVEELSVDDSILRMIDKIPTLMH